MTAPPPPPGIGPRPTLKQVAVLAGVSWKTVSRVVNGESGVAPATRDLVRRIADEVGYRPDAGASSLRRRDQRTATVGVLLDDLSNPYGSALLRAVEDSCRDREVSVFAASLDEDGGRESARVADLLARRVDGIILAPVARDLSPLHRLTAQGYPLVLVDREQPDLPTDQVVVDNVAGAREATEHLLRHGHRRIAFLGDRSSIPTARARLAGHRAAMTDAGLRADDELCRLDVDTAELAAEHTAAMLRLPDPPTAFFTARNEITVGALRCLRDGAGTGEVGLVGFDDFPLADLLGVTVIAQDVAEIGRQAADRLFARLDGDASPPQRLQLPTHLVDRGSAAGVRAC